MKKTMKFPQVVQATDKLREVLVQTDQGWAFKPGWDDAKVAEVMGLNERAIVRLRLQVCGRLVREVQRQMRKMARAEGLIPSRPVKAVKEDDQRIASITSAVDDLGAKLDALISTLNAQSERLDRIEKMWS
jgi:hypothetical protein